MTTAYIVGFEIATTLAFGLCLRHAWRTGRAAVLRLLAAVIYGLVVEGIAIQTTHAYAYSGFALSIWRVPLIIGLGWSTQLYAARLFSDATTLPQWARPFLEALVTVFLDLVQDPVAIRLGMWHWPIPLWMEYFGVPFVNFWGFFWLVVPFSATFRLLAPRLGRFGDWLVPPIAFVIGVFVWGLTGAVLTWLPYDLRNVAVAAVLAAALATVLVLRPSVARPDSLAWLYLLGSIALFLVAGLLSGVVLRPPALLLSTLFVTCVAGFAYWRVGLGRQLWRRHA